MSGERVTVWFVDDRGPARPSVIAIEGTKTAQTVKLDRRHPLRYVLNLVGAYFEDASFSEIDALNKYRSRMVFRVEAQRKIYEEAQRKADNARWLIDTYERERRETAVWCERCGCNVARPCCCAKDCQEHPSGRSSEVTT